MEEEYYLTVKSHTTKIKDGVSISQVEIWIDTFADLPNSKPEWAAGSTCFIIDTQEVKFLNSKGEWV